MCVPNGHGEVRRVVGDAGLEVGFHPVRQIVGGERRERDGGQWRRLVRRAPDRERASSEVQILLGALELVGGDRTALSITRSQAMSMATPPTAREREP